MFSPPEHALSQPSEERDALVTSVKLQIPRVQSLEDSKRLRSPAVCLERNLTGRFQVDALRQTAFPLARGDFGRTSSASEAEVSAFRANLRLIRRARRQEPATLVARFRRQLHRLRDALVALRDHGPGIQRRHRLSLLRQAIAMARAHACGVSPSDFYTYRLYLPERLRLRRRIFPFFSGALDAQQHLIESFASADYTQLRNKDLFARTCLRAGIPTIPILAEFALGAATMHIHELPPADLFCKPSDLMLGLGHKLWEYTPAGTYAEKGSGVILDAGSLVAKLAADSLSRSRESPSGRLLLQRRIWNHESMLGTLTPGGLATIRLVSCLAPSGEIDFLPPVIRMPVGDGIVDNFARGGIAAPIDIASGEICGPAWRKDKELGIDFVAQHPTTGSRLEGFRLPCWSDVLALAKRAHLVFAGLHFIGWDIAIQQQGPILVEGNAWWDVDLTVLPHDITLADTPFLTYYNHYFARRPSQQAR